MEEDQTKPVCFIKKKLFDKVFFLIGGLRFANTMELYCNVKILNLQLLKFFLVKLIFFL